MVFLFFYIIGSASKILISSKQLDPQRIRTREEEFLKKLTGLKYKNKKRFDY